MTVEKWEKLQQKRVVFGHQSVGGNILDAAPDVASDDVGGRFRRRHRDVTLQLTPGPRSSGLR